MRRKSYVLTARAVADLREARVWSRARWGKELTTRYFEDLHEGAQYIAENYASFRDRQELAGGTALLLYPVREHYIVYEPLGTQFIAIVAVVRQGRDIPSILQKWAAPLRRELIEIRSSIERGEIRVPTRSTRQKRRKK
ncbi:MAG TPA: type II toxin-antitoxin system RelE/ParE family toxin [Steroidobacter sp.]|uniref:type II toxin-antitoxin system RelE/ParE family toxin n=1 Tax=Steroidobacter sp. TaxID=1978227 RepID=UPI002ED79E47